MRTTRTRLFVVAFTVVLSLVPSTALGQLTVTDDTYVSGAAPTTINGSVGSLVVQGSTTNKPSYSYVRFDLMSLGAVSSSQVQKATLRLYVSAVTVAGGFDVIEVTSPAGWAEGTLSYNTSGASTPAGTLLAGNVPVSYPAGKYEYVLIDVTQAVKDWLNGVPNNGLVLKPNGTSISVAFSSKEDTTYSHDPELNVVLNNSLSQIPGQIGPSQVSAGNYGINISGTAATASQFDHVTSQCLGNQFAVGITPAGHANCFQVMFSNLGGIASKSQLPATTVSNDQANNFGAGLKQTFTANTSYAGLNIVGTGTDPTTLGIGDMWFNTTLGRLNFRKDITTTKSLAYLDDLSGFQNTAQAYTDTKVATEATARIAGDAATLSSANAHADAGDAATLSSANGYTNTAVSNEATARALGDAATLSSANTYTDAEKTRAMAAEALKANLAGGNLFTGGKQTLADAAAGYASLNVPNSTTAPTTPGVGDIWLVNLDPHLNFRDMNGISQMLAFTSDVTAANASTLTSANSYADTKVATEATARVAGDAATLSSANAHADTGDAAALSSANGYTNTAVSNEATARALGDAATLTSANTYTDAEKTRAMAAEALKANLAGGNIFTGGSQVLAPSDGAYASLNVPNSTTTPTTPGVGDIWLVNLDPHLNFRDMNNATQMLAFFSDITTANSNTLTSANSYADTKVATEATARIAGDTATLSSANAHADAGDATTLSSANAHSDAAVLAESVARAAGDAATLTSADAYTDGQVATINTSLAGKANLAGGNIFTGGSQVLAPSDGAYASLNVPNSTTAPTTPGVGDIWLVNLDPHLNFRDMNNATQMLAFFSDITTANSNTLTSANSYADTKVATEATARIAGDTATLSSANAHADAGDATTLSSANAHSDAAVLAESVARAAGDAATLTSADAYTDGQVATINTSLAGKANLAGGNIFTGNQSMTGNASITGNETVNGLLTLPASAPGNSQPSNAFQLSATDSGSVSQSAQLQALADGSLSFQFGPTAGSILPKLSIAPTGLITFAPGQTFPGTNNGTVTQVNTGAGLSGGPISTTGTISIANAGVTNAMLQNNSIGVIAGTGIGVSGTSSLGGSFTIANTGVLSFNNRIGAVAPLANDYSFAQLSGTDSATSNLVYNNQANLFTGGKQTLPASVATFASLNFPNTGVTPSSPATGDVWLTGGDGHLQFQSAGGLKSLAFTTDIAAGTVTGTGLTLNQLIVGNGSSAIKTGDLTGDVTTSGSTATTLAATIAGVHTFSNAGNSFTGSGAGLVNLTAANISAGTAGINITGNAATASIAATATTAGNVTGIVAVANGGTGATTAANARTNLVAAASGANADITSMTRGDQYYFNWNPHDHGKWKRG